MKRVLLDTSVYGLLAKDKAFIQRVAKFIPSEIVVYGISVIRQELRDTPRTIVLEGQNLRMTLLQLYDSFVKKENHDLKINKFVIDLAEEYFTEYKRTKGPFSQQELRSDFLIIASATLYQLDVVVSGDVRTMLSEKALQSYKRVNKTLGFRDPEFIRYEQFKKLTR